MARGNPLYKRRGVGARHVRLSERKMMMKFLKAGVACLLILLAVNASQGQSQTTAEDYVNSGMAHLKSGDTEAALADANKAVELNPRSADAFLFRATVRSKKGDVD